MTCHFVVENGKEPNPKEDQKVHFKSGRHRIRATLIRPNANVCTAGYGEGGYETSFVSRTAPEVEDVLLKGIKEVLGK